MKTSALRSQQPACIATRQISPEMADADVCGKLSDAVKNVAEFVRDCLNHPVDITQQGAEEKLSKLLEAMQIVRKSCEAILHLSGDQFKVMMERESLCETGTADDYDDGEIEDDCDDDAPVARPKSITERNLQESELESRLAELAELERQTNVSKTDIAEKFLRTVYSGIITQYAGSTPEHLMRVPGVITRGATITATPQSPENSKDRRNAGEITYYDLLLKDLRKLEPYLYTENF